MAVLLHRKKGGDWYVVINHQKQRTSRKLGKVDKRTAEKAQKDWTRKLALGLVDFRNGKKKNTIPAFGEFFQSYLIDFAQKTLKQTTWKGYSKLTRRHLLPVWENKKINEISKTDIKKLLLQKKQEGLIISNLKICISAILQSAVEQEILEVNPCRNLGKAFRQEPTKTNIQVLNKEQVTKFLETIRKYKPEYYDFALLLFRTGLRLGEALALCWDSVDFENKQIIVRRNFTHNHFDTPKNHKFRRVDMSNGLCEMLQRRYQERNENLTCWDADLEDVHLVFPKAKNGEPMNPEAFRRSAYTPMLEKAGLPRITIHSARHTFASLLLQANAPIHYVQRQLGHSNVNLTVSLYGHLYENENRDVLDSLDD